MRVNLSMTYGENFVPMTNDTKTFDILQEKMIQIGKKKSNLCVSYLIFLDSIIKEMMNTSIIDISNS